MDTKLLRCVFVLFLSIVLLATFVTALGVVRTKPFYKIYPASTLGEASSYSVGFSRPTYIQHSYTDARPRCRFNQDCLSNICNKTLHRCVGKNPAGSHCFRNFYCQSYQCDLSKQMCV